MSQLETSLNGEKLLVERPRGVGRDLRTSLPSLIAASLDGLAGSNGVAREELCARRKKKHEAGSRIIQQPADERKRRTTHRRPCPRSGCSRRSAPPPSQPSSSAQP